MDPNATLARLLELVKKDGTVEELQFHLHEILELVEDLDTWLSKGGLLPERWKK